MEVVGLLRRRISTPAVPLGATLLEDGSTYMRVRIGTGPHSSEALLPKAWPHDSLASAAGVGHPATLSDGTLMWTGTFTDDSPDHAGQIALTVIAADHRVYACWLNSNTDSATVNMMTARIRRDRTAKETAVHLYVGWRSRHLPESATLTGGSLRGPNQPGRALALHVTAGRSHGTEQQLNAEFRARDGSIDRHWAAGPTAAALAAIRTHMDASAGHPRPDPEGFSTFTVAFDVDRYLTAVNALITRHDTHVPLLDLVDTARLVAN